jgi:hypothetical protein
MEISDKCLLVNPIALVNSLFTDGKQYDSSSHLKEMMPILFRNDLSHDVLFFVAKIIHFLHLVCHFRMDVISGRVLLSRA